MLDFYPVQFDDSTAVEAGVVMILEKEKSFVISKFLPRFRKLLHIHPNLNGISLQCSLFVY